MWKVPLFDLNFDEQEIEAVQAVLRSRWISLGAQTEAFERNLCDFTGAAYAVAVTNCTAALHLALHVLGIGRGDEVIVPSMTFAATVNSVTYTGARPVFADIISLTRPVIDPDDIKRCITEKSKAICVMHYAGYPCNMDAILDIASRHHLFIVEDAAHGIGGLYNGKALGTIGDIGCYSFYSNKNMSTGEGGAIVTNSSSLASRQRLLRSHGMTTSSYDRFKGHATRYDIKEIGFNYRIDDMRSAIGIVQLKKLSHELEQRHTIALAYRKGFAHLKHIRPCFSDEDQNNSAHHIFPIVLLDASAEKRDLFRKRLEERGVQTSVHYPPVHSFSCYKRNIRHPLPQTEMFGNSMVTLPLYGSITQEQLKYCIDAVSEVSHNL